MAEGKLDLPDDLLSSKPSDQLWTAKAAGVGSDEEKVPPGLQDESKDQLASDSSIPLSPQWLYNKQTEAKMEKDMRAPISVSLGNSSDPSQKDGWRLDGSEDKKDWRRVATESENSRRWREEERETGLLGARRDRRKTDRRNDNVSVRETMDGRALLSADRWHDGSNRNSGHEARRDSKWSSRWGPEDKEKESRTEKRIDVEKEKEDGNVENQSAIGSNRSATERDTDSRDKWRPRHRMEVHSTGSTSHRAAPGFGLERGRVEGSNLGFTLGRGRPIAIGRSSSIGANSYKIGSVIGKPNLRNDSLCYPRGKLLDIYRRQKFDPSISALPDEMEESAPITQVGFLEPLAFLSPDAEEEAIMTDIWKGKITSSGVAYNSFRKGRSTENFPGIGECESTDGKQGILSSVLTQDSAETFQEVTTEDRYQADVNCSSWNHNAYLNVWNEKELHHGLGADEVATDRLATSILESDDVHQAKENVITSCTASGQSWQMENSSVFKQLDLSDAQSAASSEVKASLPDDSSSQFVLASPEQNQNISILHLGCKNDAKDLARGVPLEDLYFHYMDPQGNTQGPFLGADIMLWFEEGYFGTELPVRLVDAPEGTPFRNLGEVMPHLRLRAGDPSSEQEQSSDLGAKLEPGLSSALVPEITDSSAVSDCSHLLLEFNSLSLQQAPSRLSEPELQLPHSEGQSFHDFSAQDEEIVFPGRPGSSGYPSAKSSGSVHDPLVNAINHPSHPNELREPGLAYQNDNKLHPFGLFWSELEGSPARHTESSDTPTSIGRTASFGVTANQTFVAEKWSDGYRKDTLSGPNSLPDMIAARHLSRVEQEPDHFGQAEQLMSRQFQQQQLQQRNMLSSHGYLNESIVDHMHGQNLIHQQLANHSAPDLEQLLALQLQQQQRQLQLELQHQLQQQQQHFHQQQKLLQEQQQSQARQALLDQLMHGQMPDPGLPHSHVDPMRAGSVLDQVLLEQQLLHELQQQSHHPSRHFVPSVEHLAQAKFGQTLQQEQQRDLFELLSRAQHGQMQSLEHRILRQEQLQARQLPLGLRQRTNMEDKRHIDSMWPVNEGEQFLRSPGNHRSHSSGISQLDFYQQQQRPPHEDQLSHLENTLSFQDRLRHGLYETGSVPFERTLSLPGSASGMNMNVVDSMARGQGLDMPEFSARIQCSGQVGPFSSGIHSHNPHYSITPNQFHVSHLDAIDGRWSESNGQLANDWMESRLKQLHINAERNKREAEVKMAAEDPSLLWMSDGMNDDKSRQLLMELLHQKSGHQPADSLQLNEGKTFENRVPSGLYSGLSSSDHPFSVVPDPAAGLNNLFAVGSYGSNGSEPAEVWLAGEQVSNLEGNEKLPFRPGSAATFEGQLFVSGVNETAQAVLPSSKSSINKEYLELETRKHGSKSQVLKKGSVSDFQDSIAEQTRMATTDRVEIPVNAISRHSSLGAASYDVKIGSQVASAEEIGINQVPLSSRGQENILLRRPPVSHASSSQEGLSELVSDTVIRGKSSFSADVVNPGSHGTDITVAGKKDSRFRRTSSCSDADVSEPSFIDMLKSNTKKTATPDVYGTTGVSESSDGTQGARSGKKKGKKGRQIDPALLGFKVTSNRIMMGEIQRIED